jgi:hypothetical protein
VFERPTPGRKPLAANPWNCDLIPRPRMRVNIRN